ncbi:MAG: cupin domain-containing protein [Salinivirgaceae bacterium]|nr:cupin domain-containing protein [Salinivirgaceae bacterium]
MKPTLKLTDFAISHIANTKIDVHQRTPEISISKENLTILALFEYEPGIITDDHFHEELRIVILQSGMVRFFLNGSQITMEKGEIVNILPLAHHSFEVIGDEPARFCEAMIFRTENAFDAFVKLVEKK